jgi:hypothetical protein
LASEEVWLGACIILKNLGVWSNGTGNTLKLTASLTETIAGGTGNGNGYNINLTLGVH